MYYQVFIKKTVESKESQFSCDSFEEVQELSDVKRPKFVRIEYYNETGLVGTAFKMYLELKEQYITYKKIKA